MKLTRREFSLGGATALALAGSGIAMAAEDLSADEIRAIAKDAYVYGFPMIDAYRISWAFFVDKGGPQYKGPMNEIHSAANVFTPADTTVQTPNSDTPYSFAWFDLRAEPLVLTMPAIEENRYYSAQFVDLYTFNFDYLGTRTSGNKGGDFLIAGPNWKGEKPAGIERIVQSETEFALVIFRTQLFNAADIENVRKIQAGYQVRPLSAYLKQAAPAAAPPVNFIVPLTSKQEYTTPEGFNVLNFLFQFSPVVPSEVELRQRFERIGIGPGKVIDFKTMPDTVLQPMMQGMADGQKAINERRKTTASSADLFGTRAYMKNDYINRALGAQSGIFGNSKEEAYYGLYGKDSIGAPLSGDKAYTLRFAKDALPPVKAFWSLTMYDLPQQLLVANPIDRYLINSAMLPELKRDADGGLTIYVQKDKPAEDKVSNWLPAPAGPFMVVARLYLPDPSVLDGTWKSPELQPQSG